MVDLRKQKKQEEFKMREFEVAGKVNQSKKKREKRKVKKEVEMKELVLKQTEETRIAQHKARMAYQDLIMNGDQSQVKTENGKVLKKKVIAKKTVTDSQGTWEVVDKKQTVIVEEEDADNDSELSFE